MATYNLQGQMTSPLRLRTTHEGLSRINRDKLGLCFPLLLLYLVFEYGRPENPMHIPMVISSILGMAWILAGNKKWNFQIICFLIFLAVMAFDVLIAANTYWAFWTTYAMAITFLCTCIPLIHFVDSFRKISIFINTLIGVFVYMGIYAIFHSGFGPAGAAGAQDENYLAATMDMGIPLAYFSVYLTENKTAKVFFVASLGIFVAAVVVGLSRGGFVGLTAVTLYCVLSSQSKRRALFIISLMAVLAIVVAGPSYWDEMATIGDVKQSTADQRLELWTIAWRMFLDNPLSGVGPANFFWNTAQYTSTEQWVKFGHAASNVVHSMYFELLSEMGLAGAVVFFAVVYRTRKDMKAITRLTNWQQKKFIASGNTGEFSSEQAAILADLKRAQHYAHAVTGSLVGCLIPAAFLSMLYFSHFWVLTALAVALREVTLEAINGYEERVKLSTGVVGQGKVRVSVS